MTQSRNWNTRSEVQKQHIRFREQFYEVKFNVLQKAYAHFRMMFVNKDTIIGANCTLADYCDKFGTATKMREMIGQSPVGNEKFYSSSSFFAWFIRVPFLLVALVGLLIKVVGEVILDTMQKICVMLPGSVD